MSFAPFFQIHLGIIQSSSWEKLQSEQVKRWRELIQFVRNQCALAGEYQKPSQLFFIARAIFTMTIFICMILSLPRVDPEQSKFSLNWFFFTLILIWRIYVKVWLAEKITLRVKSFKLLNCNNYFHKIYVLT